MDEAPKQIDLRTRPKIAPPASPDKTLTGLAQKFAQFPAGSVVIGRRGQSLDDATESAAPAPPRSSPSAAGSVTPSARAVLEKIGWKPGQPVPPSVIEALSSAVTAAGPGVPAEVAIERLDPELKLRLNHELAAAAFAEANDVDPVDAIEAQARIMEETPAAAAGESEPPAANTGLVSTTCRRCGWGPMHSDPTLPTIDDKQHYLLHVQGHTVRFAKTYPLFDGSVTISFRSLTVAELELVQSQMLKDGAAGKIAGPADYGLRHERYRMVASTSSVMRGGKLTVVPPPFDPAFAFDEPEDPGVPAGPNMPAISAWFFSEVIPGESLARVCYQTFIEFASLVYHLDARAADSDFWKGIG